MNPRDEISHVQNVENLKGKWPDFFQKINILREKVRGWEDNYHRLKFKGDYD